MKLLRVLNPFDRVGGWALPHALLVAVVLAVAFALGAFTGSRYTANYYRTHYPALPNLRSSAHVLVHAPSLSLPTSGGIHFTYFKAQINDQSQLGSCQAWAFSKLLSYSFNWNYPHHARLYSPRFAYDAVSYGSDNGSYLEQYPPVVASEGIPQWTQMPYGTAAEALGLPDYAVDYPVPYTFTQEASTHHLTITEQSLFQNPGAGSGGLALIEQELASHHSVNIDFPVFPEYDAANATGQTVLSPLAGETDRGGHANVAVWYDNSHPNGDGTYGAILASNQWGWQSGVGADGIRHTDGTKNGYIWLSYSFVEQYVFGAAVIHVSSSSTGASVGHASITHPKTYIAPQAPTYPPPSSAPPSPRSPQPGAIPEVYGLKTADTGVDISAALNAASKRYGFSAPGYAALLGTESGIHQYAPHYPISGAGYCDYSAGLTQITVCTAAGLGLGDGSLSNANVNYVFNYEQGDANRDIAFSARLVDEFHRAVGWDWYPLYASWNLGPGYGRFNTIYEYPTNPITIQAVANFKGWLAWVDAYHVRWVSPKPTPLRFGATQAKVWNQYRREHNLKLIPHIGWFAWQWREADWRHAGGVVGHESWDSRRHVMTEDLQGFRAFWWPSHPRYGIKWRRQRWQR